jgi:hypothetical protein
MSSKRRRTLLDENQKVGEFTAVPLKHEKGHFVYLKRVADSPACLEIGPLMYHTVSEVRDALVEAGDIEKIDLEGRKESAIVRFNKESSVASALSLSCINWPSVGKQNQVRGMEKWVGQCQQRPEASHLQRQVEAFMAEFDAAEEDAKEEAKEEEVDDDGFTLVTKNRGKKGVTDGEIHVKAAGRTKRGRQHGPGDGFYGLNKLKAKEKQLKEVRKKFEADRKRLKLLKQERNFK